MGLPIDIATTPKIHLCTISAFCFRPADYYRAKHHFYSLSAVWQLPHHFLVMNYILSQIDLKLYKYLMSKLLETIKPELTRSRNLAYYGKYSEAIAGFNDLIEKVNAQIAAISDKTLITEWNRFRDDLKSQRDLASNLKQ